MFVEDAVRKEKRNKVDTSQFGMRPWALLDNPRVPLSRPPWLPAAHDLRGGKVLAWGKGAVSNREIKAAWRYMGTQVEQPPKLLIRSRSWGNPSLCVAVSL